MPVRRSWGLSGAYAMAASAAGIAALAAAWIWQAERTSGSAAVARSADGVTVAVGQLHAALESVPSIAMKEITSDPASKFVPTLTFKSKDGGYCRQFAIVGTSVQYETGVACRQTDGNWSIEAMVSAVRRAKEQSQAYRAAGLVAPPEIEAKVDELIQGTALVDEEPGLLENKWRAAKR